MTAAGASPNVTASVICRAEPPLEVAEAESADRIGAQGQRDERHAAGGDCLTILAYYQSDV
jgi:hypothetical protein